MEMMDFDAVELVGVTKDMHMNKIMMNGIITWIAQMIFSKINA